MNLIDNETHFNGFTNNILAWNSDFVLKKADFENINLRIAAWISLEENWRKENKIEGLGTKVLK